MLRKRSAISVRVQRLIHVDDRIARGGKFVKRDFIQKTRENNTWQNKTKRYAAAAAAAVVVVVVVVVVVGVVAVVAVFVVGRVGVVVY